MEGRGASVLFQVMKPSFRLTFFRSLVTLTFLALALPAGADPVKPAPRKKITLEAAPARVQEIVKKVMQEHRGTFDEIKVAGEGATALYYAEIDLPQDHEVKLVVRADGGVVRTIVELATEQLPESVRAAFTQLAGETGEIDDAAKVTEGTQVWYRAEIELPGKPDLKVKANADGVILEQVEEEDDD